MTLEQRYALLEFARDNGRTWKSKLRQLWERAGAPGPLQQVRNTIGPSGLARLKLRELFDGYFKSECEAIAELQARIKSAAMVYQYSLKHEIAADLGLTFEQVNLPYDEWAAIRNPWLAQRNRCN